MYAAYQSHHSCGGATASNAPWRPDVSCKRSAREATSMSILPLTPREPLRDLLEFPAVAVRVAERCPGEVRAPRRVKPRWARLVDLADVHATADQVGPDGIDVLDHEDHPLSRSRLCRRAALADLDRTRGVRWCQLHRPDV